MSGKSIPRTIHVAVIFSSGEIGGAERSLTLMAVANQDATIRYSLWSLGLMGQWHTWARKLGVQPQFEHEGWGIARVWRLFSRLRRERPNVIYAVGPRAYVLIRLLKPLVGRSFVVHAIRTSFPLSGSLTRRYTWAERLFPWPADAYVANSRAGVESFLRIAPRARGRMSCVPNGVVVPEIGERADAKLKGVLVLANLHALKDHLPFLEVVRTVVLHDPSVKFYFVGRDDMNGQVQRRAAELGLDKHVEFPGFIADPSDYFRRSRIFVLPSRTTEGAPTSILEAHARGIPVVAFSVGGVAELLRPGVDGLIVSPAQPEQMAEAIASLLGNPALADRLGAAGRERVQREMSLAACAAGHAAVWHGLYNRGEGARL